MKVELVLDARNAVGESPVWLAAEQSLYWVDIPRSRLCRWDSRSGRVTQWTTPEMPGCIAPDAQGGWVCAMETGIFHLQIGGTGLRTQRIASVVHPEAGMRFNDGRCDRQGRLRAGTMVKDMALSRASGALYALDDGELESLVQDLFVPNGLAFSPDGRTMYLSDSHSRARQVWAFDYDTDEGRPHHRRLFVDMISMPGRPDGAAIDEDGCYWICGNDAGVVYRFTPEGTLDRMLSVPVKKPAMCAFGGPQLDTLFVTSIRPEGVDLSDQPLAGGVFALRPGVRGLPEPSFRDARPRAASFSKPTQETLHVE